MIPIDVTLNVTPSRHPGKSRPDRNVTPRLSNVTLRRCPFGGTSEITGVPVHHGKHPLLGGPAWIITGSGAL